VKKPAAVCLIGLSLLIAVVLDLLITPPSYVISAPYAVPVLIAAQQFHPRFVAWTVGLVLVAGLLSAYLQDASFEGWPFEILGLLATGFLAILLSRQRCEAARRAQEADESRQRLQQFLGMVTHELASPLTTIIGHIGLLARSADGTRPAAEQRRLLVIQKSASQMRRLIGDLRDAAQIGVGRFTVRSVTMDLVAALREVVETYQPTAPKHRLELQGPARLEGAWDPVRLKQLFDNLISNAIKYSPEGGRIRVSISRCRSVAVVLVADQGTGISANQASQLFIPFSRLSQHQAIEGTGLGLYIARAAAEAHGGSLQLVSEYSGGAAFRVVLPSDRPLNDVETGAAGQRSDSYVEASGELWRAET
jgi:signal transduction histidine kinase